MVTQCIVVCQKPKFTHYTCFGNTMGLPIHVFNPSRTINKINSTIVDNKSNNMISLATAVTDVF